MTTDYRDTVFLPRTDFPMKADLPKREPELARALGAAWTSTRRLREASAGRPRSSCCTTARPTPTATSTWARRSTRSSRTWSTAASRCWARTRPTCPGWDCHGLPIEWQIEQEYRKKGKDKDAVPIVDFRRECREFAQRWIDVQRAEFKRLGVLGDWDDPYTTMDFQAEAGIYRELGKFLLSGALYRGKKSVMWSVVEKTALAEAEVEYHDHTSTTIWVRFPLIKPSRPELAGAAVVIWTTTPWTIPANRAVAYGADIAYRLIEVDEVADGSPARPGERLVVAAERLAEVAETAGILTHTHAGRVRWRGAGGQHRPPPAGRTCRRLRLSRCRCCRATSSPPSRAPASSTSRPAMARTISSWAPGTGSRCRTPWPRTAPTPRRRRASTGVHVFKAAEPVIEALTERRATCWRAARWSTATRTPGAPRRR